MGFDEIVAIKLDKNPATDETLARLRGLTSLETLELYDTQVTDFGRAGLQPYLPSLVRIHWRIDPRD